MKKLTFTLAIAFMISSLNAQFAPEGATWHYGEGFAFSGNIDYMKFVAEGDTIIEGVTCQKIRKYGQVACLGRPSTEFTYESEGIVYYYNPHHSEFEILYDFTAEPGDTWTMFTYEPGDTSENEVTVHIDSVDTVILNGVELKRMYALYQYDFPAWPGGPNHWRTEVLIERLGNIGYMFNLHNQTLFVCDGNYSTGLRCYEDEDFGLYETGNADSCEYVFIWTSVSEVDKNNLISIYPNPVSQTLFIDAAPEVAPATYILSDITGRTIQKGTLNNNEIELGTIPEGIYLLQFYAADHTLLVTKKMVKN